MLVVRNRNTRSTALARNRDVPLNWGTSIKTRRRITAPAMHLIRTLPRIRREKVLVVRQQIAEGTYDLDKRLNSIFDRFLEDIVA